MTAEVAVLNRSAVALAADSAVTLSSGNGVNKIFQNENKLFELSKNCPIGIMLYNNTTFFEIPWEVIIKNFRNDTGNTDRKHIFDWTKDFLDYLIAQPNLKPSDERQKDFVQSIFRKEFEDCVQAWLKEAEPFFLKKGSKANNAIFARILLEILKRRAKYFSDASYYEGFDETHESDVLSFYKAEFDKARNDIFQALPFDEELVAALENLGKQVLCRARPSGYTTGLVFAGFGSEELFPSLACVELSGVVANRLRWTIKRKVDIDRSATTAEIIPFAQRDVADTLIFGRHDLYEQKILSHFSEAMRQMGDNLIDQLTSSTSKRKTFKKNVGATIGALVAHFRTVRSKEIKDIFANETLDIVRHMPKPDLAAFAESLVTVSSMKRKVTVGPETVGGPVDVAVISRHEGFVWVKRKHYFDAALNPRYMWRSFGQNDGG